MFAPCLWYVVGMNLVCPMSKFPQAPFARAPFGENPPNIGTFTAWNRARKGARTPRKRVLCKRGIVSK